MDGTEVKPTRTKTGIWDPGFARHPELWAIAPAASLLVAETLFPSPERLDELLAARAGVRFVRAAPRPNRRTRRARREGALADRDLYDTRIVEHGEVPTRVGSWHDLMNALVWATFPRSKRALHARQKALVVPARPGESRRRPRALDALALFDEGGVVLGDPGGRRAVFGHAIYEGLVEGWPSPTASGLVLPPDAWPADGTEATDLSRLDAALAAVLADARRLPDPSALAKVELGRGDGDAGGGEGAERSIPLTG